LWGVAERSERSERSGATPHNGRNLLPFIRPPGTRPKASGNPSVSPRDLKILQLRFDGHASSEIAEEVDCFRWTVRRVVEGFGLRLLQRSQAQFDHDRS
jgi:DNA-binding NarL/FixJ family response regulator